MTEEAKAEAEQDWQGWQKRGATRKVQRGETGMTLWPAVTLCQLLLLSNKPALQIMYDILRTCMPTCIKCLYLTYGSHDSVFQHDALKIPRAL